MFINKKLYTFIENIKNAQMKLFAKNTLQGLVPLYDSDFEEKKKLKLDKIYKCDFTLPRNVDFHAKYFALINFGNKHTRLELPSDAYRHYIQMKAGFVNIVETPKGLMYLPKSISFSAMAQDEFEEVYERVLRLITEDIGATKEDVIQALVDFM